MSTKAIEKEVMGLERAYWQAIQDRDFDAALELTDDPCVVTGAQGAATIDHEQFEKMMNSSEWTLNNFEMDKEMHVRVIGDDVAIVAYKIKEELTVDGQPLTLEASEASTWVRKNGKWVCALHTESLTGDPFGRDRQLAHSSSSTS